MTEAERSAVSRTRCSEIMTRDVRTATREMTLKEAALMMREGDMGSIPVVAMLLGYYTIAEHIENIKNLPVGLMALLLLATSAASS